MKTKHVLTSITTFFLLAILIGPADSRQTITHGLFVSVIQEPPVLSSRKDIEQLIAYSKKTGVDTLFVQIYRENKSWFPSKIADQTPYRDCKKSVGEDAFALLIKKAHASKIKVHAWINLLSLGSNSEAPLLKKYGPEILTRNLNEKLSLADYKVDNQFFLEPGDTRVQNALSELVGEILNTYPTLDGIQFDYIRYPDTNPAYGFTKMNMARYKKFSGQTSIVEESQSWKNWKDTQVTGLIKKLSKMARSLKPKLTVSTTGLVPYSRAKLESYQDWKLWVQTGLVNFVTLMNYATTPEEFEKNVRDAKKALGNLKKVNMAVGAYALPGSSGTLETLMQICRDSESRSCIVFHYGSLLENPELKEVLKR